MMLYPGNLEEKLGFDALRKLLEDQCLSDLGKAKVTQVQFQTDFSLVNKLTKQTAELAELIQVRGRFPSNDYIDVSAYLDSAAIEGAALEPREFFEIKLSLTAIVSCLRAIDSEKGAYPELAAMASGVDVSKELIANLAKCIDEKGEVSDQASSELIEIRTKLNRARNHLRKVVNKAFAAAQSAGYSPEGASITVRQGRLVIPIVADQKRKIEGFIQDYSSSGQTVYLEPEEALESNNEIRIIENEERREIYRILLGLTDAVCLELDSLRNAYEFLAEIDLLQAKVKLANLIGGVLPTVKNRRTFVIKDAKHPLLQLSFRESGREVVPLNMDLDSEERLLVISGPNAGGKSIALKTLGLLQYMFQCGMLIPISPDSEMGFFSNLFVDIGDQQSLENDLSTYSSHLANMRFFLDNANEETLILIDEFGTGTEPRFGAAMAESILEAITDTKCLGVITTHYTNLKEVAESHSGIRNGAMLFDTKKLAPLYQLEIGKPGSSFALEVAQQIGIPEKVVSRAKEKLGDKLVNLDVLLGRLEQEKIEIEAKSSELNLKQKEVAELSMKYNQLHEELSSKRKDLIASAKFEAEQIIASTNREIEKTIRHIKENRAEKKETQKVRKRLGAMKENLGKPVKKKAPVVNKKKIGGKIAVGDLVEVNGNMQGEVLELKGTSAEVMVGSLKTTVAVNKLVRLAKSTGPGRSSKGSKKNFDLNQQAAGFSPQLDVRGKRPEEAWGEVEKFLDRAMLVGYSPVKILHGRGSGALKQHIRNQLKTFDYVEKYWDEEQIHGGDGITIVSMK